MRKKAFNQLPEAIEILGENFNLTNEHKLKLQELENEFGRKRGANIKITAYFIKYDLDNWNYRLRELKKLKATVSEKRYILMMGDIEGKKHWNKISKKKKASQTEEHYIKKFGEKKGKQVWDEICNKRGKSNFSIEYWMEKGFTEEQAKKKISEISKKGSLVGNANQKKLRETNYEEWAKKMPNTKYYWIERGYSEEEAIKKVFERQSTFSKEICIKKYGEKEGLRVWKDRQKRWFNSLMESDTCSKIGYASKESLKYFIPIIELLENNNISYRVGIENNSEYRIYGNNRLNMYDFVIEDLKLCFEYNGECFHPNPEWKHSDPDRWDSWIHIGNKMNAEEKFEFDQRKLDVIKSNGFDVYEIWGEKGFNSQLEKIKTIILEKLDDNSNIASNILF